MRILAIDTSTEILGVAVTEDGRVLAEHNTNIGRRHFEKIIPAIQDMLKKTRLTLKKIDAFAVAVGPGSFTGIRIGVTTAKGLAFALKKPLMGISTLDVIAENAKRTQTDICVIMDAKRELLYSAIYKSNGSSLKRKTPYLLVNIAGLLKRIKHKTIFLGDGLNLYQQLIQKRKGTKAEFADISNWLPRAANLALLAGARFKTAKVYDANKLKPLYLYPKECQIRK